MHFFFQALEGDNKAMNKNVFTLDRKSDRLLFTIAAFTAATFFCLVLCKCICPTFLSFGFLLAIR